MADAAIIVLCDAVVNYLNEQDYSLPFEAKRCYLADFSRDQLTRLQVPVAPNAASDGLISRGFSDEQFKIQIGLLQAVEPTDVGGIDALIYLVEEIRDSIRGLTVGNCGWVATENEPIFSPDHLNKEREFRSVLTLTMRTSR